MLWLASLLAAGPAALLAAVTLHPWGITAAAVVVMLVVMPSVGVGWTVGQRGTMENAITTAALGTGMPVVAYVLAMAMWGGPGSDDAAAIGVVIFGLPTFAFIAALVGIGFGLSRWLPGATRPSAPVPKPPIPARPDVA
jgi:hypothetical protein